MDDGRVFVQTGRSKLFSVRIAPETVGASGVATLSIFPYQIFPGGSEGSVLNAHDKFPFASEARKFMEFVGGDEGKCSLYESSKGEVTSHSRVFPVPVPSSIMNA